MRDKSRGTSVPIDIIRYRNTYLISGHLLGCLRMLPLHDVALDNVERSRRCAKNCHPILQKLTYIIKLMHFLKLQTTGNGTKHL